MRTKLLYLSGSFAFAFAIFHCFFWVLFNWSQELARLSPVNAGIVQVSNIMYIFIFIYQGFASFKLAAKKEPFTFMEKSILIFIVGFYFLRAALGIPFFGVTIAQIVVIPVCLIIIAANLLALRGEPAAGLASGNI
ncbi:MAG: hypothetical protein PVG03_10505 [Desulfarculaceae bacterium]|jgi:hypothetical protein